MNCPGNDHTTGLRIAVLVLLAAAGCGHDSSPLSNPDGGTGDGGGIDPTAADEILFQAALVDFNAMSWADAQTKFDQLLADYPDSPRRDNAAYLSGRCVYELGDYAGARDALVAMRADYPTSPFVGPAAYFTGRARFRLTPPDYAGALTDFSDSITEDPQGLYADNAHYYVARTDYELADYPGAIAAFDTFLADYPTSTYVDNADYFLGRCYFNQTPRDYAGALPHFADVLAFADSIFLDDAQFYTGRCHYGLGDPNAALGDFQELESSSPTSQYVDNSIYYELRIHVDQLDCVAANADYDRLLASFPTSSYVALALTYLTNGGC